MDNQGSIPKFNRPGVSDKFLHDHGIRNVGKEDARGLCSTVDPGVWIPYKDYEGIDVEDGDLPFGRLRRSEPGEKPRYHQKGKTGVHAYFPKPTIELESSDTMILIEGEFKALCLAEHGFPVIGLPGIWGYGCKDPKGEFVMDSGIEFLMGKLGVKKVYYIGDSDTALNYHFSHASVRLRTMPLRNSGCNSDHLILCGADLITVFRQSRPTNDWLA